MGRLRLVDAAVVAWIAGCGHDTETADPTAADRRCSEATWTGPQDGASGVRPLFFSAEVDSAAATLEAPHVQLAQNGEDIPGDLTPLEAGGWLFTPEQVLAGDTITDWTAGFGRGCTDGAGAFTTSLVGAPLADPEALVGQTFHVLADTVAGPVLWGGVPPFVARIDDGGPIEVSMTLAPTDAVALQAQQDACQPTGTVVGRVLASGLIRLEGADLVAPLMYRAGVCSEIGIPGGGQVPLHDWEIIVALQDGPPRLTLVELAATLDVREVPEWTWSTCSEHWVSDDAEVFCSEFLPLFGVFCEPCDDGVVACWRLQEWGNTSEAVDPLLDLSPTEVENILCADTCTNGVDDDGDGVTDSDAQCDPDWPG